MTYPVFPLALSFGAVSGIRRHVEIFKNAAGHEVRNAPHAHGARLYNAGIGIKSLADMHRLLSFFEARSGQLEPFLIRDPMDHHSGSPGSAEDELIALGDGATISFSLMKSYSDGQSVYQRPIAFPDTSSLYVSVDGQAAIFSWDAATRNLILDAVPPAGAEIRAGFEFYTLVRFDTPSLEIALESFGAGRAISIPLIEVLSHD